MILLSLSKFTQVHPHWSKCESYKVALTQINIMLEQMFDCLKVCIYYVLC